MPWARRARQSGIFSPRLENYDMALVKNVGLTESKSLQFRPEGFNVFAQFCGPQSVDWQYRQFYLWASGERQSAASRSGGCEVFFLRNESALQRLRSRYAGTRSFAFPGCGNKESPGKINVPSNPRLNGEEGCDLRIPNRYSPVPHWPRSFRPRPELSPSRRRVGPCWRFQSVTTHWP
jgi:hypothetical protein